MSVPVVPSPVIVTGARGTGDQLPSGLVPLTAIAPTVEEGEVLWMSRSRDYRIQLKGEPKRVVGDQVLPERPRAAQFENYSFKCNDPETNKQLRESKSCGYDFWAMSDLEERKKASQEAALVAAAEAIMDSGDPAAVERLSVVLASKGFKLPKREKEK